MTWTRTLPAGRAHAHPEPLSGALFSAVELMPGDRAVMVLDQRKLPQSERYEYLSEWRQVEEAIKTMMVRGAPAIGIAAAYALALAVSRAENASDRAGAFRAAADALAKTRPTAVNLTHAIATMSRAAETDASAANLASVAREYHAKDVAACKRIGALGQESLPARCTVLLHCNAGALATGGYGTAIGVVRAAIAAGKSVQVIASETRPLFQGSRLTAWELARERIPVTVVTDSMVASLMARGAIDAVIVGADRIAKNGDVANKIGTYSHAVVAAAHGVPFFVAAPWSTVDVACESGAEIPIEERGQDEVLAFDTTRVAPPGVAAQNPAFDVTPARLIRAIYTERGATNPTDLAGLA